LNKRILKFIRNGFLETEKGVFKSNFGIFWIKSVVFNYRG